MAGAIAIGLGPGSSFSLEWTHSVEKVTWHEDWRVTANGLTPIRAAVQGYGAGMEPGPDAKLIDGWMVWFPTARPVRELALASSGATGGGWLLCGVDCVTLGMTPSDPVILRPCPDQFAQPN
ncbi:DUF1850 domain-containing protein [Paracoccus amoyensis]|nr:DUF1850 domain-containing protein [Paracoccus amoyensis]